MEYKDFNRMVNEAEGSSRRSFSPSITFPALMRKVYVWMTLAMAITGITAYGVATSPAILGMILLIPVALVLVLLICITLIGGYVGVVASLFWPVLLGIIGVIVAYKIIKYFIDK